MQKERKLWKEQLQSNLPCQLVIGKVISEWHSVHAFCTGHNSHIHRPPLPLHTMQLCFAVPISRDIATLAAGEQLKSSLPEVLMRTPINRGHRSALTVIYAGEWQESSLPEETAELSSTAPVVPFSLDYAARLRAMAAVSSSHL